MSQREITQVKKASVHNAAKLAALQRRAYLGWREVAAIMRHSKPLGRIDLHVMTLRLVSPPPASYELLWMTVYPVVTTRPLSTKRITRTKGTMALDFAESLELLPGAIGTKKLASALAAEKSEDASSLTYVLWGSEADGSGREALAEGQLPLRQLWSSGQDVVRTALPLFNAQRAEVAEATVTVHALHAIRAVTAPASRTMPATAQPTAGAVATERSATSGAAPPHAAQYRSAAEEAMAELVAAGAGGYHDARIISTVSTAAVADRADRAMLWKASMHLGREAVEGAAAVAAALPSVEDQAEWGAEMAHNFLVQFVCFGPAGDAPAPESIYLSFQLYHFAPRTTTRALLLPPDDAQAAASRVAAGEAATGSGSRNASRSDRTDAVVVEVRDLSFASGGRDGPWSQLLVEVEIAGVQPLPADAPGAPPMAQPPIRTPYATKRGRRVDFGFSDVVEVPLGSTAAAALTRAMRSNEPGADGTVSFVLKAPSGGRDSQSPVEVASGTLGLQQILKENRDEVEVGVPLNARSGFVGTLTVSVRALSAMLQLQAAERAQNQPASRSSGGHVAAGKEEDLMLVAADSDLAREGPGLVERFLVQPPTADEEASARGAGSGDATVAAAAAAAVAARADNEAFATVQSKRLQSYLQNKSVAIDVWDGASLLQIGTARVPLAALLKKGTERVGAASVTKEYLSVDVLDTALTSIDAAPSADAAVRALAARRAHSLPRERPPSSRTRRRRCHRTPLAPPPPYCTAALLHCYTISSTLASLVPYDCPPHSLCSRAAHVSPGRRSSSPCIAASSSS